MPLSGEDEISLCNDEPEAEAHCIQNNSSQNFETDQAVGLEAEEKTSSDSPSHLERNLPPNPAGLDVLPERRRVQTESVQCLSTIEVEEINENMTFSDAEEDQPNKKQNSQDENESLNSVEEANGNDIQEEAAPSGSPQVNEVSSQNGETPSQSDEPSQNNDPSPLQNDESSSLAQQACSNYNSIVEDKKTASQDLNAELNEVNDSSQKVVSSDETDANQGHGNSQRVGVVGSMNEVVNPLSMDERLARHETEQGVLSTRLRESVVKREELVARYKNTRERLSNLKKQRQGLLQEEHSLLQSQGAPEDPYGESIPEADTWTIEQLKQALLDFEGLKNKVVHLKSLYETQSRTVDQNDEDTLANIRRKNDQIDLKGSQIDGILAQLKTLLQQKQGHSIVDMVIEDEGDINEDLTGAVAIGEALSASTDEILASSDVAAKQEHLNKLKAQLSNMKTLLDETHNIRLANFAELERRKEQMEVERRPDILLSTQEPIENEVISFKGQTIRLSEDQFANPEIFAKSQQLREAKQRLAKMEEVMAMISMAREQNKPLSEVLTPEYMAILEDAQNELEGPNEKNESIRNVETVMVVRTTDDQPPTAPIPARSDPESDHEPTAMELEPVKNQPTTTAVAERVPGSIRKDIDQKHNRNIWYDGATSNDNLEAESDLHLTELLNLQQDLRQKKNNLEDLMTRVGKSSAFLADNSDNISVNVSDGISDGEEIQRSWGAQAQSFRNTNERPAVQATESFSADERLSKENARAQKNRNKLGASQMGGRPASGFPLPASATINNFNGTQGVRPKVHPTDGNRRPPNVSWEVPTNKLDATMDNSHDDVHNMMSSALTQLNSLQHTINHLYDTMRTTQPQPTDDRMTYTAMPSSFPRLPMYPSIMPPPTMQAMCTPYGYNCHQHTNDVSTQGHVMGAIQQCLSQLHLQSMEIQALNKQLQIIEQKEKRVENQGKNRSDQVQVNPFTIRQQSEAQFPSFRFSGVEPSSIRDDLQSQTNAQARRLSSFPRANIGDDLDFGNQNFYPPFDGCGATNVDPVDARIERPRAMQMQDPAAAYVPMQSVQSQSSTNILNNKVLPGTRANNYWDNFRSYSHQNPLSSTRKSNSRGDNFSGPIYPEHRKNSRAKEPIQAYPNRLHENRRPNLTSRRNDHVNRASEKNRSYGVMRGTSRDRFPPDIIVPEPQYPPARLAKNENRIEDRFFQPAASDAGFMPSCPPYSNLQVRSFEDYRPSRSFLRLANNENESRSEVLRQAEGLLQKQHPQFLLKLFSYLSKITDNTDQHVALELLKELSNDDTNFNNRWMNSFSSLNNDEYHTSVEQNRDQINKNQASAIEKAERNEFSNFTDLELSEAFNCAGESIQAKEPYDLYKNLTAGGIHHIPLGGSQAVEKSPSVAANSSNSSFYTPMEHCSDSLWKRSKDHVNYFDTSCRVKDKSPELSGTASLDVMHSIAESKSLSIETSPNLVGRANSSQANTLGAARANTKNQNTIGVSNNSHSTNEYPGQVATENNENTRATNDNTFDSVLSAVFRKIMDYFNSTVGANEPSERFLEGLHLSILRVIEGHSKKSYSPDLFASIENRLRRTLHSFKGKRICEIQQELPAAVSQVLIHQYCSHLYHNNMKSLDPNNRSDYLNHSNGQSNLPRQNTHRRVNSAAIDEELTVNRPAKSTDEARNRKSTLSNVDRSEADSSDSKLPVKRPTNSTRIRSNAMKSFDLILPLENSLYFSRLIDSPEGDEPEGSFYGSRSRETNKVLWNNASMPLSNGDLNPINQHSTLPVHDLAEADQSRDKPQHNAGDGNSNDRADFPGLPFDRFDFTGGHSNSHHRQQAPEQGLDEIPTKLRIPLQIPDLEDDNDFPEDFDEQFIRLSNSPSDKSP